MSLSSTISHFKRITYPCIFQGTIQNITIHLICVYSTKSHTHTFTGKFYNTITTQPQPECWCVEPQTSEHYFLYYIFFLVRCKSTKTNTVGWQSGGENEMAQSNITTIVCFIACISEYYVICDGVQARIAYLQHCSQHQMKPPHQQPA